MGRSAATPFLLSSQPMQATYVQRLRLKFSKMGPTRFISHLDVARTWERTLNRAKLPVTYSKGFNRRPKIQFATATSLGITSQAELMDLWLDERLEPALIQERLMARIAPGLAVLAIQEVPLKGASLQTLTRHTTYEALIPTELMPFNELSTAVQNLLAAEKLPRQRKAKRKIKTYNLRPLILNLTPHPATNHTRLLLNLLLQPAATGRPDEVLRQIGLDPLDIRLHRLDMVLAAETHATSQTTP